GIAEAPERAVRELPLLSEGERAQLQGWNRTGREHPQGRIHELFEAQVRRTPEAVALEWGRGRLSYGGVNRRANRLAHRLRELGVGPEERVGVRLERGPELVAALLGVLKAGGAYVPLDPEYPAERLAYMESDSGARLVVSGEWLSEQRDAM